MTNFLNTPGQTVRRLFAVAVLCSVVAFPAWAGQLTLGTSAPPGSPLTISPGSTASLLVTVVNDRASDVPSDFMSGWQANLLLIPDSGAAGTVRFGSAIAPTNYVYGSVGNLGISRTISTTTTLDDTLFAFDLNFPFSGGAQVPTAPGANLLEAELSAAQDASGSFGLYAVAEVASTLWADAAEPQVKTRYFVNVPRGLDPVRIGDVMVAAEVTALQAGDADQDLDFDQFDVIQVLQARKYLSGQPATWGEGDWNGAPGGSPGNPPLGDGLFNQLDLISALKTANYRTGPYAALTSNSLQLAPTFGSANHLYIAVPEPPGVMLLIVGALVLLAHASRRIALRQWYRVIRLSLAGWRLVSHNTLVSRQGKQWRVRLSKTYWE